MLKIIFKQYIILRFSLRKKEFLRILLEYVFITLEGSLSSHISKIYLKLKKAKLLRSLHKYNKIYFNVRVC